MFHSSQEAQSQFPEWGCRVSIIHTVKIWQLSTWMKEPWCLIFLWFTSLVFYSEIYWEKSVDTFSSSLTISCVKVEMSTVELSGCLVTSCPSLGCRITLYVMMRLEVLLMSLVTACNSSFVISAKEPGGKTWNRMKKTTDEVSWIIDHETVSVKKNSFSCLAFS